MKIAFVLTSLANVGPVIVVRDLIMSLPNHYDITVYYIDDINEISINRNIKIIKVNFFENIDLSNYDVVHTHMMRADFFGAIRKKNIKKLIVTMHSDFKKDLMLSHGLFIGGAASLMWYISLLFFDKVVFLTKSQMSKYSIIKNNCVIYNGRDVPNEFLRSNKFNINNNTNIVIGACAHVVGRKGFKQVIDFLALNKVKNYIFRLIGDGPALSELIGYAKDKGVDNKCEFLGRKDNVFEYIKDFNIYVMTSYSEGMPLALLEAAACGCPIVCSRLSVISEIFSPDEVGFYEIDNIFSFGDAIENIVSNGAEYSRKAFARYQKYYTSKAMSEGYMNLYL